MASLIFKGAPSDDPNKPRKIPKVAVYVAGAAVSRSPIALRRSELMCVVQFALSTGLTLLILPFVRQAARLNASSTQFLSNRHLLREPTAPPISSRIPRPDPSLSEVKAETEDPAVRSSRGFNDREEKELYGAPLQEGEEQPIGGLMGLQALGIATAVVFGTAGLGAWAVGKMMGVRDVRGVLAFIS